jgi:hypothetical protein
MQTQTRSWGSENKSWQGRKECRWGGDMAKTIFEAPRWSLAKYIQICPYKGSTNTCKQKNPVPNSIHPPLEEQNQGNKTIRNNKMFKKTKMSAESSIPFITFTNASKQAT